MTTHLSHDRYSDRLDRVMEHVYAHLEDEISFDRLAEVACLSPYHWSRIYAAMRGETIAASIRRLRLQRAADRLANSELDIATVAGRAGYGSSDSFGRAFKEAFGSTPAAYRSTGAHVAFQAAGAAGDASGFPVDIMTLPARRCAGIDHQGSYMEIDRAMGKLFGALAARNAVPVNPAMIGVFFDDPDLGDEAALRSRACLPVADAVVIDAPMVESVLRGGTYARLRYTGPYAAMRGAYRWFLGVWLPNSGYEPDDAPIFEAYLNDPRDTPQAELRTDIHLPLRERQ
ncbi:AraC family transcriptional regulator [Devosia limi DSM 17137]|uniref:AraC family transcriptional regulator n=1 Tax=Devosia limi DSM 17137 TaxID=1121477 RepID=A0A0F5LXH2_9HYPH|nr:AraC family transcriptional regulator [Devosia limi]KKB86357.1 AraC family transcriptional regulator [Devosia limi DSM 17137]SHE92505.1 AraC family transcriptional regulator [Devosia limi DSM 17137]